MTTDRPSSADPAADVPGPGRHIEALDGLRGLAVLAVLIFHVFQAEAEPAGRLAGLAYKATRIGQSGVDLFFVLSGFLITGILHDTKGTKGYFRNFYGRRTVRIFPLYYGVLIVATILLPAVLGHRVTDASPLALWTYTANIPPTFHREPTTFGHFWTLAVEEQFYLVWPAVVFACSRTAMMRVCVGCIVGSIVVRLGLLSFGLSTFYFTLGRLDSLALGGLLALAARGAAGMAGWRPWAGLILAALMILIAPLYVMNTGSQEAWLQVIKYTLLAGLYGAVLVLAIVSTGSSPIGTVLRLPACRFLGKYSYGIYVFHPFLISLFVSLRSGDEGRTGGTSMAVALRVVAILSLSVAAAWLSYHLFEKHFLKLKRFFEYGRSQGETPAAPVASPSHGHGRGFAIEG